MAGPAGDGRWRCTSRVRSTLGWSSGGHICWWSQARRRTRHRSGPRPLDVRFASPWAVTVSSGVGTGEVGRAGVRSVSAEGPATPVSPLSAGLTERRSPHQRLPRVRPPVQVLPPPVTRLQVRRQPPLELGRRGEVAALEEPPRQYAEPHLHLVPPRPVRRREHQSEGVTRIG